MIEEAEPGSPILEENIYKTLEGLLSTADLTPKEFWQGTNALSQFEMNQHLYAGAEAIETLVFEYIKKLKKLNRTNYKTRVRSLVTKYSNKIPPHLKEDILEYLKSH